MNRNLHRITLVIPTYNRYPFLLRLLRFYETYGFPVKILILDSSSDSLEDAELLKFLEHPQIVHQKFPADIFFARKLSEGLKKVFTYFSVLCADDDYIIPTGLEPCMNFLQEHPDYAMSQGFYVNHFLRKDLHGRPVFFWSPLYIAHRTIDNSCPIERFRFSLENFAGSIFYAVYRTEDLQLIWEQTATHVWDWGLSETLPMALGFLLGKLKILPVFYSSREAHGQSWCTYEHLKKIYSPKKCESVIQCMAGQISRREGKDLDSALLMARDSLAKNLERNFSKYARHQIQHPASTRILNHRLIALGPKACRFLKWRGIKAGYRLIFGPKNTLDFKRLKESVLSAHLGAEAMDRIRKEYLRN